MVLISTFPSSFAMRQFNDSFLENVQASLESIRDSLAEELVKLTEQVTIHRFFLISFISHLPTPKIIFEFFFVLSV